MLYPVTYSCFKQKKYFPGDIIERTPHAADITLALEQFSKHASDYNLDECLDNAFATFKVDKWNNNRQEIYEIMHHYL